MAIELENVAVADNKAIVLLKLRLKHYLCVQANLYSKVA